MNFKPNKEFVQEKCMFSVLSFALQQASRMTIGENSRSVADRYGRKSTILPAGKGFSICFTEVETFRLVFLAQMTTTSKEKNH